MNTLQLTHAALRAVLLGPFFFGSPWIAATQPVHDQGASNVDAPSSLTSPLSPGGHDVVVNGIKTHYEVAGSGPVVVIQSPSWGIGSVYLLNGLEALTKRFTLIAYDTPGSGSSDKPANLVPLTSTEIADHLEALRRNWSLDRFDLIGHSQGSALAIAYAARYPEPVRKVVLIGSQLYGFSGSHAAAALEEARRNDPRFRSSVHAMDSPTPATDVLYTQRFIDSAAYYLFDPEKDTAAFVRTLTTPLSAWPSSATAKRSAPVDQTSLLPLIKARTLVIVGRDDPVCPVVVSKRISSGIDNSQLLVYERTGHFPWIEQPARFFEDVAHFLSGDAEPAT